MSRGLPFSLAVHLLMLAVVVIYGSYVPAPPLRPQHLIRVRLTEAPKRQSGASEAAALPPSEPVIQQPTQESPPPAQEPEPQPKPPEPEPQTLPVKKPEQKVVTPPEDKPKPQPESKPKAEKPQVTTEPEPSGGGAEQPAPTGEGEPVLSGTDEPFPFAWYLDIVKGRITRNWNPPQLGIRAGSERSCAVHFVIESSGAISRQTLVSSSGVPLLDREGLRAVQAAHPLPPLPREFGARSLGVTFIFHLRSGP